MLIRLTAPGKPDLTWTKEKLESYFRAKLDDETVDLFLMELLVAGTADFKLNGVTATATVITE